MSKVLRLYWWSEVFIQKKNKENYGDLLGKYLVEKISGREVKWLRANKFYIKNMWQPVYVTVGSVLEHIGAHCIVWGSGIMSRDAQVANAKILAVRGPLSRKHLQTLQIECPEIYGDPALLMPLYYAPKVDNKYTIGIIPHINDLKMVTSLFTNVEGVKVINFNTNDVEATTTEILECEYIISSSLHGVIVAHAYRIPAVQVKFSNNIAGDGVKYHDYLLSVGLNTYAPEVIERTENVSYMVDLVKNNSNSLPSAEKVMQVREDLLKACPFLINDV